MFKRKPIEKKLITKQYMNASHQIVEIFKGYFFKIKMLTI